LLQVSFFVIDGVELKFAHYLTPELQEGNLLQMHNTSECISASVQALLLL